MIGYAPLVRDGLCTAAKTLVVAMLCTMILINILCLPSRGLGAFTSFRPAREFTGLLVSFYLFYFLFIYLI